VMRKKQIELGDAVLIDVREDDDWREDHAKGAKHLSPVSLNWKSKSRSRSQDADHLLLRRRQPSALVARVCRRWIRERAFAGRRVSRLEGSGAAVSTAE